MLRTAMLRIAGLADGATTHNRISLIRGIRRIRIRIRRTTLLQGPTIVGWPRPSWSPGAFDKFAGKSLLPERASLGPSAPMFWLLVLFR